MPILAVTTRHACLIHTPAELPGPTSLIDPVTRTYPCTSTPPARLDKPNPSSPDLPCLPTYTPPRPHPTAPAITETFQALHFYRPATPRLTAPIPQTRHAHPAATSPTNPARPARRTDYPCQSTPLDYPSRGHRALSLRPTCQAHSWPAHASPRRTTTRPVTRRRILALPTRPDNPTRPRSARPSRPAPTDNPDRPPATFRYTPLDTLDAASYGWPNTRTRAAPPNGGCRPDRAKDGTCSLTTSPSWSAP